MNFDALIMVAQAFFYVMGTVTLAAVSYLVVTLIDEVQQQRSRRRQFDWYWRERSSDLR